MSYSKKQAWKCLRRIGRKIKNKKANWKQKNQMDRALKALVEAEDRFYAKLHRRREGN